MDGNIAATQGKGGLFRRKIPFRADEDGNFVMAFYRLCNALPGRFPFETVCDELAASALRADELRSVNWLPADYGLLPKLAEHL